MLLRVEIFVGDLVTLLLLTMVLQEQLEVIHHGEYLLGKQFIQWALINRGAVYS